MSKQAIDYLKENKNKYPQEQLIKALKRSGYSDKDIRNSVEKVYDPATEYYFWDFKNKTHYTSWGQRLLDLLFGVILSVLVIIVSFFLVGLHEFLAFLLLVLYLTSLILTFNRRRYIFYGLLFWVVLIFVLMIAGVVFGLFMRPF